MQHSGQQSGSDEDTGTARTGIPNASQRGGDGQSQIDTKDRTALRDKLEVCIDPLHPEDNQQGLVNIVTGQVLSHPSLNVDNATELGTKQMEEFERTWPVSFHETLHKMCNYNGGNRSEAR